MTEREHQHIFTEWLHQYKGLIFKIVQAYGYTPMDREDLFQEITIQVWRSIPTFRQESAISTWIYRIALNTAISWVSKEKKYRDTNNTVENLPDILLQHHKLIDERMIWLYKTIRQLDEIDRSIILLLLDGYSYKEMAAILGITETNVGVKINRIKKQLIIHSKKISKNGI
ncbi:MULTISPECIES: RNA polymerase sigma factor [Niastella]|uniref:RNA polymerase sigma factor n=1 Tax=Niastella soli TaxID=2821487 RepID=A0ABS3YWE9_9BACT|nr:RNA polymerase sigma factor [Niastella soli]MBO9202063.1 RNA polymerase sigma factor [Niastella soli]